MSNIFICKHCGKEMDIKQFGRHLNKIHNQKYENYVRDNLNDFIHLNWKLCLECGKLFHGISSRCGKCYTKSYQIKENQYIICKHCNKQFHSKIISQHLKKYHNILFKDYIKENLNDFERFGWCECVICRNITKKRGDKHEPTCSYRCMGELREVKYLGRPGHKFTEEEKKKNSLSHIGKKIPSITGNLNPACRPEVRNQISQTRIEHGVAKGEKNGMYGRTHTPEAIKKIFSHRKMNKLEKIVANELDKANIPYYFQYFIVEDGICKSYDFKIKNRPLIIEVDGDFWHGNPNQSNHYEKVDEIKKNDKVKDELAQKRSIRIIRLWESDIKKDPSIILKSLI